MYTVEGFLTVMDKGGPVMWVIFAVAWLALVLLVERALRLHTWITQAKVEQQGLTSQRDYQPPRPNGRGVSPVAMLYHSLEWQDIHDHATLDKQIHAHLAELLPKLEGVLPTIAVLASLLPMLGLLGTVIGMIQVFESIAIAGTGDPRQMADGISQALLTTASGLIIAIPVVFFHHLLAKRLHILLSIVEQSVHVIRQRQPGIQEDVHEPG